MTSEVEKEKESFENGGHCLFGARWRVLYKKSFVSEVILNGSIGKAWSGAETGEDCQRAATVVHGSTSVLVHK
jgi:hypothetical protein